MSQSPTSSRTDRIYDFCGRNVSRTGYNWGGTTPLCSSILHTAIFGLCRLVFREPNVTVAPRGSQVTICSSLLAIYSCFCYLCMYPACNSGNKWVSRKSKGKMSPPEASSKERNQTQSMFPLLYLPLFPAPA
ncbi:hypothetical protein NC652_029392 [Populus alba x Populus x berolinensis]|nr:hypothetical protein NC652_029392 [Populus alba x Populus x berolinensis]